MENIQTLNIDFYGKITEFVIIDRGNDEFTSMPKSIYDEMIAAQENQTTL